jgi:hypothetical protein
MLIVANTYTRPSKSVPFFVMPGEVMAEFLENYRYTGKSISTTTETSPDGLTAVVTTKWSSRAAFQEFVADPLSDTMRNLRSAHQTAHAIQASAEINYIPSEGDVEPVQG